MEPYEKLAGVYDRYWGRFSNDFMHFLEKLSARYGLKTGYILDMACGTASLAYYFAKKAVKIVGFDISPHMLHFARKKCENMGNIELVQGDFRSFSLKDRFDLILCCFDAINYIESIEQLQNVFECVSSHLKPGGFFIFDAVNEKHFLDIDSIHGNFELKGAPYSSSFVYNRSKKTGITVFRFENGEEVHRQIPIEYEDILEYISKSMLSLVYVFSNLKLEKANEKSGRLFYLLKKSG